MSKGQEAICPVCGRTFRKKTNWQIYDVRKCALRAYRAANPNKFRAWSQARYATHSEEAKARAKVWRAANVEKIRVQRRARRAANPEKFRARFQVWRAANPEKVRALLQVWRAANPKKVRALNRKHNQMLQARREAQRLHKLAQFLKELGYGPQT